MRRSSLSLAALVALTATSASAQSTLHTARDAATSSGSGANRTWTVVRSNTAGNTATSYLGWRSQFAASWRLGFETFDQVALTAPCLPSPTDASAAWNCLNVGADAPAAAAWDFAYASGLTMEVLGAPVPNLWGPVVAGNGFTYSNPGSTAPLIDVDQGHYGLALDQATGHVAHDKQGNYLRITNVRDQDGRLPMGDPDRNTASTIATLSFNRPLAGIGFWITDGNDPGANLVVRFLNGNTVVRSQQFLGSAEQSSSGNVLFVGYKGAAFDRVQVLTSRSGLDGATIDNIEMYTTPEPGTWALMATGLVGVATAARRRTRQG